MIIRCCLFLAFICSISLKTNAQTAFQKDISFIKHLESLSAYDEGVYYLSKIQSRYVERSQLDSLWYQQGKFQYLLKNRLASIKAFERVGQTSMSIWNASRYYSGLQYAYLGDYESGLQLIDQVQPLSEMEVELKVLQHSGIYLLQRDLDGFENLSQQFTREFFELRDHQDILMSTYDQVSTHKPKSRLVAGILSAIIPGGGKYYQGLVGQGTMSLMTTGIFGLQAYEGYRKNGKRSGSFIVFGSLFSVFYVANIWGSVVSVSVQERAFNENINETILLHMHIPLRLFYK